MKKTAIIFGHTGQDGYYLMKLLKKNNIEVYGVSRSIQDVNCSINNIETLKSVFRRLRPDYIFNFAAMSTTHHEALFMNHEIIGTGTCNILEAARVCCPLARIFISGSGLQFVNEGDPLDEKSELDATSIYAVERNYTYYLAKYFRSKFKLNVYFGFFFTHDSPLRKKQHMSQKIVLAARAAAEGELGKFEIGDIKVRKEYLFAGDAVEAIWTLVNQDKVFEAVIGTGKDYSIEEWFEVCFDLVGLNWEDYVSIKTGFEPEYRRLVSCPDLIYSLGWRPKVDFYSLAKMMMEDI